MEGSITYDDENIPQNRKKRQQLESPFSAATPKSRLGKEPKRIFGFAAANSADENLEETCIESNSRPGSVTSSDVTFEVSTLSDVSTVNGNEVDPNLEQTELFDSASSVNYSRDLSMVVESDDKDADATMSASFEQKANNQDHIPTPVDPRLPMSPIPMEGEDSLSAPADPTLNIGNSLETIDTHSVVTLESPNHQSKSIFDYSLHVFEMLEQKVAHEEDVKELRVRIDELCAGYEKQIKEINEARVFEEKMLMQQMESTEKKAIADRKAAKAREQSLENLVEEMRKKLEEPNEEKKQLENQVAILNSQIEELTEKALKVDMVQLGAAAYEDQILKLQNINLEATNEVISTKEGYEILQNKLVEAEQRAKLELDNIRAESSANIDELKVENEVVRKMLIEEIERLEREITTLQSQKATPDHTFEEIIRKFESEALISSEKISNLKLELSSSEEIAAHAEQKVARLELEVEKLRSDAANNISVIELERELDELRSMMVAEVSALEKQLEMAGQHSQVNDILTKELEASERKIRELNMVLEESQISLATSRSDLQKKDALVSELTASLDKVQQSSDSNENLKLDLESSRSKIIELSTDLENIQKMLESAKRDSEQCGILKQKIEVMETEIGQLTISLHSATGQLESSLSSASALQLELAEARQKSAHDSEEAEKNCIILMASQEENRILRVQLESAEANIVELRSSLEDVQKLRLNLEQSEKKISQLEVLEHELEAFRQKSVLDNAIKDQSQKEFEESQKKIVELTAVVEDLKHQVESASKEIENSKESILQRNALLSEVDAAVQQNKELLEVQKILEARNDELGILLIKEQHASEQQNKELRFDLESTRHQVSLLESQIEELKKSNEEKRIELTAQLEDSKQKNVYVDVIQSKIAELTSELESLNAELVGTHQTHKKIVEELGAKAEDASKTIIRLKEQLEESENEIKRREDELIRQTEQNKEREIKLQSVIDDLVASQNSRSDEVNTHIIELEASISVAQNAIREMEQIDKQKDAQLIEAEEGFERLKRDFEIEKSSIQQEHNRVVVDLEEKLVVAEKELSRKENSVITLESHIETISRQFEERLAEANVWKSQAMSMSTLTDSLTEMQQLIKEMADKLEASNRRVVEVEEMALNDITLIQDEKKEQSVALEEARALISELEKKLVKAEKEIERLEKICDDFDDDERELKNEIRKLELEIKQLKGIKTPPKVMGLLQQARLGVPPLSRESSHVEPPIQANDFYDAHDSFQDATNRNTQKSFNHTARQTDSPNAPNALTALHPDDRVVEKSFVETPSKKANRSNCQQQ